MPLPIPNILENAARVITTAREMSQHHLVPSIPESIALKAALQAVNEKDLLAVLNEVGSVYTGLLNMQVLSMGARANRQSGNMELALQVDFGMGPRVVVVPLPAEEAKKYGDHIAQTVAELTGGIITTLISDPNG